MSINTKTINYLEDLVDLVVEHTKVSLNLRQTISTSSTSTKARYFSNKLKKHQKNLKPITEMLKAAYRDKGSA